MAAQLLVGVALGGAMLYIGWRRARAFGQYWRYKSSADRFERGMKAAREELQADRFVRVATAEDAELVEMMDAAASERPAIEACGFTHLGDAVVDVKGRRPTVIMRVFVDDARTTLASLGLHVNAKGHAHLSLTSYRGDEQYTTRRSTQGTLAQPPSVHVQSIPGQTACPTLVARHRAFAKLDGALRMTTLEEATAAIEGARAAVERWRAAQSPDELLDADLRCVLGEQYPRTGKMWARRLRERIPHARLHRD